MVKFLKHPETHLMLLGAAACLGFGLVLPTITMKELVFWKHTFSVLTGIQSLYQEKYYFLAAIIFVFSIIFPIAKLLTLSVILYANVPVEKELTLLKWLGILGKWSMLDVFVVAVMIVVTKISGLVKAQAHIGIYVFTLSIMLSMFATMRIEGLIKPQLKQKH